MGRNIPSTNFVLKSKPITVAPQIWISICYRSMLASLEWKIRELLLLHLSLPPNAPASTASMKRDAINLRAAAAKNSLGDYFPDQMNRLFSKGRAVKLTELLVECAAADLLHNSFYENRGMKQFISFVEPNYQPPTRKAVTSHLRSLNDSTEKKLCATFNDNRSMIKS